MIRDKEITGYKGKYLHSTFGSGYQIPNMKEVAALYHLEYTEIDSRDMSNGVKKVEVNASGVLNLLINEDLSLEPSLPRGHQPQDMVPEFDKARYDYLNAL